MACVYVLYRRGFARKCYIGSILVVYWVYLGDDVLVVYCVYMGEGLSIEAMRT